LRGSRIWSGEWGERPFLAFIPLTIIPLTVAFPGRSEKAKFGGEFGPAQKISSFYEWLHLISHLRVVVLGKNRRMIRRRQGYGGTRVRRKKGACSLTF
jgi:hypothetical protein